MKLKRDWQYMSLPEISNDVARKTILTLIEYLYKEKESRYSEANTLIVKNVISVYAQYIKRSNYQITIEAYKNKFIRNEAIVEPGVTKEEKMGLGLIYDYISTYDFDKKEPNIFVEGLRLHSLLYSQTKAPEFGGKLRDTTAILNDFAYDVPDPDTARREFQNYLTKKFEIDLNNIFSYIDESIISAVDCIRIQPFNDGNKRVFRAILNLQLARIGIPPLYIKQSERAIYKKALEKAIVNGDYHSIITFYYHKMCDAIIELDLMKTQLFETDNTNSKKLVITPKVGTKE